MQTTRSKLVIGNWKMNGSFAANSRLLQAVRQATPAVQVAVAPSFVYLGQAASVLVGSTVQLAAQDVSAAAQGAYTGDVSAAMLAEAGVRLVIIGHSERRQYQGESDELVARKCQRLLEQGLQPVICVGETLAEREAGQAEAVVARQLQAVIRDCGIQALANAVLAYEPVWAIGTGRTATPTDAQAIHAFLRQQVAAHDVTVATGLRILYGGSVKADNAASLFAMPDIDGALVGGASLVANDFLAICRAAVA